MKASKGQAITTAVFAVLKIIIAIIVFVLLKFLIDSFLRIEAIESGTSITAPGVLQWWIFGLPFLIPGILGCVAAGTRHKAAYGVYMAACIIACIVDSIFCFLSFAFLFAMANVGGLDCHEVAGKCVCSSSLDVNNLGDLSVGVGDCSDLSNMIHMSYGVAAMLIIGWMLCLAGSIISCVSTCCGEQQPGQVIVMGSYPGQVTVSSSVTPHYAGAQYPVTSDTEEKNQYKYNRMA